MSLILTALAVAAGAASAAAVNRFLQRRAAGRDPAALPAAGHSEPKDDDAGTAQEPENAEPRTSAEDNRRLETFPCKLGDVVTSPLHGEAWLAGCLLLSEGTPVRAIFIAPEAGADRFVVAAPQPSPSVHLVSVVKGIVLGAEPPMSLEVGTVHYLRKRRLPLRAARLGAGAPNVGETCVFAEYEPTGVESALFVVIGPEATLVLQGPRLAPGMFDVYPGAL